MKNFIAGLAILSIFTISCTSNEEDTQALQPVQGSLAGDITTNTTLDKGNYTLTSSVRVKAGTTLTIAAGSTLTAQDANGLITLTVEKGGKLNLLGTAAEPIVCTAVTKTSGSWGGIVMYGDAPVVASTTATTAQSEDGTNTTYGGTNAADNSGTLKYVRVEYAGRKIADGTKELNCFSFYAVGNGTTLENLVAYKGSDDGFEFYGGTVNASNLVAYGNSDDSFDWQDGWRGTTNTNWYAYQEGTANFGMEVEAKGVNNSFYPIIDGITLKRSAGTLTENNSVEYDAMQFKKQGNGEFKNIIVEGYTHSNAVLCRIQDVATNNDQVNSSKIKLQNVKLINNMTLTGAGSSSFSVNFPLNQITTTNDVQGARLTSGLWCIVNGINLLR